MLFLELPPADMLPPAGHRAGPGRAHTGPITRSGRPGGRPWVPLRASAAASDEAKAAPQSRSNSSPSPRPPRSSRPRRGGRGPGPGWHRPEKSVREKSRPGVCGARRPGVPPGTPSKSPIGSPPPRPRLSEDA